MTESAPPGDQGPNGRALGATSGPVGAAPLDPRDVEAMAVNVSLTHDLPIEEARSRILAALARGERRLEVP